MRWLLVHPGPEFSVHDVYSGWVEALRGLGEQVAEFNLNDRIRFYNRALLETGNADADGHPEVRKAFEYAEAANLAAQGVLSLAYTWWPDVVFLVSAFFTPPGYMDAMRMRGHKLVVLHTECPYQDERQLIMAAHADLNLVNDPATLDQYRKIGPAEYMPHAFRPTVHYPGPGKPELKSDFCFAGTGWPSRLKFLEQMDFTGLDVLLAGAWPGIEDSPLFPHLAHASDQALDNEDVADVYRSSRSGINFYRREGDDGMAPGVACGPREIEMAAAGLFFLRDPRPESDELFPMLPAFTTPGEASERLRWWLGHDAQREEAAMKACAAVQDRTFDNHARRLLKLLDTLPKE